MIERTFNSAAELEEYLETYTGDGDIDTYEGDGTWGCIIYETQAEFDAAYDPGARL